MAGSYSWLTFAQARQQLSLRLADPNQLFWTDEEVGTYIVSALRMFNVLTFTWKVDFQYNSSYLWNNLGLLPGSPRLRTVTDTEAYTQMEYMLLEPPSGGVWTGTSQFSISDLAQALQRRRDEMLQVSNCNQTLMTNIPLTPNTIKTVLPDTTIDVARVRFIAGAASGTGYGTGGYGQGGYGGAIVAWPSGVTLYRDDTVAQEFYEAPLYELDPGTPSTFSLSSEPPLSWVVDIPPNQPGTYEAVVLQSGAPFNPPVSTVLGIPDDFAWVLQWGALADLLGRESEATDRERASYALRRYQDGLNLLLKTPWIMLGKVNGAAVSVDSIYDLDRYSPEWDSNASGFGPVIVAGGTDFIAAPTNSGVGLTLLGNAPVPVADDDWVQISRSDWDCVLDLAQGCFAAFKMGGSEWKSALELEARAIQNCAAEQTRLKSFGCFSDILVQRGQVQERAQERYKTANQKQAR